MRKLKFKNGNLKYIMNWDKTLKRYSAIPTNLKALLMTNFKLDIPNNLIMNAITDKNPEKILDFLSKNGMFISGVHENENEGADFFNETLNGYPNDITMIGISKNEKDAEKGKILHLVFDGYFYYLPKARAFTFEELALQITEVLLFDKNDHRWNLYANGIIEDFNGEKNIKYFNHPKTNKNGQVLCPICGEQMFYLD